MFKDTHKKTQSVKIKRSFLLSRKQIPICFQLQLSCKTVLLGLGNLDSMHFNSIALCFQRRFQYVFSTVVTETENT